MNYTLLGSEPKCNFFKSFLRKRRRVSITFHRLVPVFLDAVNRRHVQSDETLNNRDFHQCYLMSLLQKLPKNSFMLNTVIAPFKDNNSEMFILLVMIECPGRLNRDNYVRYITEYLCFQNISLERSNPTSCNELSFVSCWFAKPKKFVYGKCQ